MSDEPQQISLFSLQALWLLLIGQALLALCALGFVFIPFTTVWIVGSLVGHDFHFQLGIGVFAGVISLGVIRNSLAESLNSLFNPKANIDFLKTSKYILGILVLPLVMYFTAAPGRFSFQPVAPSESGGVPFFTWLMFYGYHYADVASIGLVGALMRDAGFVVADSLAARLAIFFVHFLFTAGVVGLIGKQVLNKGAKYWLDPASVQQALSDGAAFTAMLTAISVATAGLTAIAAILPGRWGYLALLAPVLVYQFLATLLLPSIQAAREAAQRNISINNLKMIGLALASYLDQRKRFPMTAIRSPDGTPLLSWRVQILPYMEETELYNQFRLNEPWNSPHNMGLLRKMPRAYKHPNFPSDSETMYLALKGANVGFDGPSAVSYQELTKGASATPLVLEADPVAAVEWTKPADWEFDPQKPTRDLGHIRPKGFLALFADSHVDLIPTTDLDATKMYNLIRRDGVPNASPPVPSPARVVNSPR